MRNQKNKKDKLAFRKFQIAEIKNPEFIIGGKHYINDDNTTSVGGSRPTLG